MDGWRGIDDVLKSLVVATLEVVMLLKNLCRSSLGEIESDKSIYFLWNTA